MNLKLSPEEFERFRDGDKIIFNRVFAMGKDPLVFFCTRKLNNRQDAEELVDDVFMALSNFDKSRIKSVKHIKYFLYNVAWWRICDRLARKAPVVSDYSDPMDEITADPQGSLLLDVIEFEAVGRWDVILKEIDKLPRKRREVMRLRLMEWKSNGEIGNLLDMSPSLVSEHKKNGSQSLMEALRRHGFYLWLMALCEKIF